MKLHYEIRAVSKTSVAKFSIKIGLLALQFLMQSRENGLIKIGKKPTNLRKRLLISCAVVAVLAAFLFFTLNPVVSDTIPTNYAAPIQSLSGHRLPYYVYVHTSYSYQWFGFGLIYNPSCTNSYEFTWSLYANSNVYPCSNLIVPPG
jgi:hypothetical protein